MISPSSACTGSVSRRSFMQLCSLGLGGWGMSNLLKARTQANEAGAAGADTAVILLWLPGGPPHMETYDMKPDAPLEYRGAFRPIRTNVLGIDVCEHLPRHARVADRFSLIRSIAHTFADHGGGHKKFLTGRDPREPVGFVNDTPMIGSMVAEVRRHHRAAVPNYISGTDNGRQGIDVFSFGSAYLGPRSHPFTVVGDPSAAGFEVKDLALPRDGARRIQERVELLRRFDRTPRRVDGSGTMQAMDEFNERALQLITTNTARRAFELSQEPERLRERYGKHVYGQRCLLARRLVEAGSSFVTMVLENPVPGKEMPRDNTYNWDSHAVNCHIFEDTKFKLPRLDQAVTALIEDLYLRGLDRKVLLIVTGEFGRTPRISYDTGSVTQVKQPGRDHWPQAMSVLVSGGGLRMGQVIGSTNAKGEHPKDRPLTPNDLWATMFRHLGVDHLCTYFPDHTGRPMPILPDGEPIRELI